MYYSLVYHFSNKKTYHGGIDDFHLKNDDSPKPSQLIDIVCMEQSRKELTAMGYSYQGGFTLIVVLFILLVIVGSAYVC
ncbi:YjcZ family sporulation protein [Alkalihalophilus marmarensis]|uniref:Uncharacterized protein n=3 Tax=Alkalihalophilus TaxID=2893060 RepID=U6SUB5_9BACI|nr:YjcZ family sporulation protein [Alkalihalophilus marmarensis]ERN54490.1 hypothetical protein A33I_06220 [Alkalihalophilus marmarensis DSM 21297]